MAGQEKPNVQSQGMDALSQNVMQVLSISQILGKTLGPQGIDILVINSTGDSITSNDGATILSNLAINSPVANALMEGANILSSRVGDGTTTMTVIAGQLCYGGLYLNKEEGLDTVTTTKGYTLALAKVNELLDKYSLKVDIKDKALLKKFVNTTLTGKNTEGLDTIYDICIDAVTQTEGNLDLIKKYKLRGTLGNTRLINGVVLDLDVLDDKMDQTVESPKIIVLDDALELVNPALDMKIDITDQAQYMNLLQMEKKTVIDRATKIKELGANVVICQRNINDYAIDYFTRNGILAVRNVKKSDADLICKLTNAQVIKNLDTAKYEDLGIAENVTVEKLADERYVIINNHNKVSTILIAGANRLVKDEYERGIDDALGVIKTILKYKTYVYGAGNIEVRLAEGLREYAKTIENGKLQSAIEEYAKALEHIPKLLADSSGQNRLIALGKMRLNDTYGVDVENAEIREMLEVLEPTEVKRQAYTIATEYSNNILRIGFILQGRTQ